MGTTSTKWMWVTLASVLLLGVGAGVLLDRFVLMSTALSSSAAERERPERHRDRGGRFLARLTEDLNLSSEQRAALEGVLSRNHERAHEFWQQSRREFDELRRTFRADIRALLTPEQKPRFDEMLAEYDARRRDETERER